MRIKLDENIPVLLKVALEGLGHDVDTVSEEQLSGASDQRVWSAAQGAQRFLVTQDLDFSDSRRFAPGTHYGILIVRLGNPSRSELILQIEMVFQREPVESWARCFVVLTDRKIRIRHAP